MVPGLPDGWPHTSQGRREPTCTPPKRIWWGGRREEFERMWKENVDVEEMADRFECSPHTIYSKASQWKLGRRRPLHGPRPGTKKKKKRKARVRKYDSTGQRRFQSAAPAGSRIVLEPHHPAHRIGTTFFPSTVIPAAKLPRLLKEGHNSSKIGKMAEKGRWRGMPIFTLTLVERETCPRTCLEWATCYGNNMPFAQRILDDGTLTKRLWGELAALNAQHPAGFIVRLHVLGDFFSVDYVDFWRQSIGEFRGLQIFGFTARRPNDPIGAAVIHLTADFPTRVAMRFSGAGYETHSSEVVDKAEEAMGIVCPAQRDEKRSCASCGLCWTSTATISFLRH